MTFAVMRFARRRWPSHVTCDGRDQRGVAA